MGNDGVISRFSAAELRALRARGESQTDLARVRAKSEAELKRDIADDPDFRDVPEDWHAAAVAVVPMEKTMLSLRVDAEVVEWFKRRGPGYESQMNDVLRAFVDQSSK